MEEEINKWKESGKRDFGMDREELINELKKFKKSIEKEYKIENIILFGSRATENYKESSDVDLIIIGKFKGNNSFKRAPPLYLKWSLSIPVDFLCYTPKEFNKLKKKRTIVKEAVEKGIEIK
jgi:uncharacterized protein